MRLSETIATQQNLNSISVSVISQLVFTVHNVDVCYGSFLCVPPVLSRDQASVVCGLMLGYIQSRGSYA